MHRKPFVTDSHSSLNPNNIAIVSAIWKEKQTLLLLLLRKLSTVRERQLRAAFDIR